MELLRRHARARRPQPEHRRPRLLRRAPAPTTTTSPGRVGARRPLRVLHLVHAVPAGALAGGPAGPVRVPVDDLRAHRPRGLERIPVRRRDGAGRGREHGARARAGAACSVSAAVDPRYVETLRTYGRGAGYQPEVFDVDGGRGGAPEVDARRGRRRRAAPERATASWSPSRELFGAAHAAGARARSRCSTRSRSACSRRPASSAPTSRSPRGRRSATT